ncbi:TonB-dependent receptor [Mucilaginibacter sp. cycad4]|uniref:TonB-dependent receptor n=1 Tax=Mucilaginibacter sp. cycad4 TaxID=3342096 RepID=UPI002AABEB60|nr:TonB-dependent receptor [Mucilaginibacter gossypii]WPV01946.1 TonB-dependent receptor [Mucilaginibacter gossypii]
MRSFYKKLSFGILFSLLLFVSLDSVAQTIKVFGIVKDEKGVPLPGVTVTTKQPGRGTTTDTDGKYSISVGAESTLIFRFVGYTIKEVVVGGRKTIDISLLPSSADLGEVIVTGVFDKRTALSSSIAISTLNAAQISKQAPLSAADLLKNIPGVYVTSAIGEIRNSVYSRGVSGTSDGGAGYYYVSLQEDGLPVSNVTFGNWGPDYFLRPDATLGKLEAVRGGTSSILGNNAPGGIFNYISKTGGSKFSGEFRAKYGLEGDGHNPFYRGDLDLGGPLNSDGSLTYNLGGFYRYAIGAKDPGYAFNKGGQVKGNILKKYKTGSIKFYLKYLNDHNGFYQYTPTTLDYKPAPGFTPRSSEDPRAFKSPYQFEGQTKFFNPENLIHSIDRTIGVTLIQHLDSSLTFNNAIKYSYKTADWNTTTLVSPLAMDNLITYAALGLLGRQGTYSFTDAVTGAKLGNVTSQSGFDYTVSNSNFPGGNIQQNSLFIQPFFVNLNRSKEIIDQASLTKTLKNMSFTFGGFYAHSDVHAYSGTAGFGLGTMVNQPHPVSVTLTSPAGQVYQLTSPENVFQQGGGGFTENKATQNQLAFFLGHNWQILPNLNLDYGVRFETLHINGFAGSSIVNPKSADPTYGGADNNPLTVYDNYGGSPGTHYDFNKTVNTFSYSAGLNYELSSHMSVYSRFSSGRKAPDLTVYFAANTPFTSSNLSVQAQKIIQAEIGLKISDRNYGLFITPFYSNLSHVPNIQLFVNADNMTNYNPPVQYESVRTFGLELESKIDFTKNFNVRAVATFQNSKATHYTTWVPNANGPADDQLISYSGNKQDNSPNIIVNVTPAYNAGRFYSFLSWQYLGQRQFGVSNTFKIPGYSQFNLGTGYDFNKKLQLGFNVNNLLNTYGIAAFNRPGDFFTLLTAANYTREQYEADKKANRIASAVGIQPRAYYLTLTYKF